MKNKTSKSLATTISELLLSDFRKNPLLRLPPLRELCKSYQVSLVTMFKAIEILKNSQIVESFHGHGLRLTHSFLERLGVLDTTSVSANGLNVTQVLLSKKTFSADRLYEKIKIDIVDGKYKAGTQLPKLSYFSLSERVSDKTVRTAYNLLVKDQLAHRCGKHWLSGPDPKKLSVKVSAAPLVILLLQFKDIWSGIITSERTSRFSNAFTSESENCGVEILPVFCSEIKGNNWCIVGRNNIRRMIADLGASYLGTLVPSSQKEFPDLADWIKWLVKFKKPIVWFDRFGIPIPDLTFTNTDGLFYRCHFDEPGAVHAALSALVNSGHSIVGFPNSKGSFAPWVNNRISIFRQLVESNRLTMQIIYKSEPICPWKDEFGFQMKIQQWRYSGLPHIRALLQEQSHEDCGRYYRSLLYNTPILMYFLNQQHITALVAPNDLLAKEYYVWLRIAGIQVPEEISLISFDNCPSLHPLPITSVDFGFAHLGWAAFHVFLGDIPLRHDSFGNVPALSKTVFRRSFGQARTGTIKANLNGEWR